MVFELLLSPHALSSYRSYPKNLKSRMDRAFEDLRHSPFQGPRIKQLKGSLKDYLRYRVGDYRILYAISPVKLEVYIDYIQHRKDVYR